MNIKTKIRNIKRKNYSSYCYVLISLILFFNLFLIYNNGILNYSDDIFSSVSAGRVLSKDKGNFNENLKFSESLINKDKDFRPQINKNIYRGYASPQKIDIETDIFYHKETDKFKRIIGNDLVVIKSDDRNTFNLDSAIFSERFIYINDYEIKDNSSLIEVIMYIGLEDGTELSLYKDENYKIGENYSKVVIDGIMLEKLIVKDGFVSFYTNSFSAYYVTFPPVNMLYEQSKRIYLDTFITGTTINYFEITMYFTDIGWQTITSNPLFPLYNNWDAEKFFIETWTDGGREYLQLVTKTEELIKYPLYMKVDTTDGTFYQTIIWSIRETNLPVQTSSFLPVYTKIDDNLVLPMSSFFDYYSYIMVEYLWDDLVNPPENYLFYGTQWDGTKLINVTTPHYYPLASPNPINIIGSNYKYSSILGVDIEYTVGSYNVNLDIYNPYVPSYEPNFYRNMTVYACNENGCITDTFDVNITKTPLTTPPIESNLSDNILAYYKLDEISGTNAENSYNSSGDGTASNSIVFTSQVDGIINTGADFKNNNDYISIPAYQNGRNQGTVSLWVYPTSLSGDITAFGADNSIRLGHISSTTGNWSAFVDNSGGTRVNLNKGGTAILNEWAHLVLTWDNTNVKLYNNGVLMESLAFTGNIREGVDNPVIGGWTPSLLKFNGTVDEVGIWSIALDSDKVLELFESGNNGLSYPFEQEGEPIFLACNNILTTEPSQITNNYALLNGNYYGNISASVYFKLREYPSGDWETIARRTMTSPSSFTSEDLGPINLNLKEGTTYEYRAIFDYNETSYSCNSKLFTTLGNDTTPSVFNPQLIKQPSNKTFYHNTINTINIKDYLAFYEFIEVIFEDKEGLQSILLNEGDSFENIYYNITLPPSSDTLLRGMLRVETFGLNQNFQMKFKGRAVLKDDVETNYFTITISDAPPEDLFSDAVNFIYNIFPDADSLSIGQRMTYVIGVMVIVALVLLLIAGSVGSGVPVLMLYVIAFLEFFLFIYFIAIGYIPIVVWVLLLLIVLSLSYFKFFNNAGS